MHSAPQHTGVAPKHVVPFVQSAVVGLQLCGVLPEHWVAPGVQTPVQEPALHT